MSYRHGYQRCRRKCLGLDLKPRALTWFPVQFPQGPNIVETNSVSQIISFCSFTKFWNLHRGRAPRDFLTPTQNSTHVLLYPQCMFTHGPEYTSKGNLAQYSVATCPSCQLNWLGKYRAYNFHDNYKFSHRTDLTEQSRLRCLTASNHSTEFYCTLSCSLFW